MREPIIVVILTLLIKNTLNQRKMANLLDGISAKIDQAAEANAKIAADVKSLHAQISALPASPSAEEIAAVQAKADALVASLNITDDLTPDAAPVTSGTPVETPTTPVTPTI